MNFEKALRILGLNANFTEEELKKAHRELANKYHPDRNKSPKAEAMMKDINEARDYLLNYKKGNNRNKSYQNNYSNFKMNEYRQQKIRELSNKYNFDITKYKVSNEIKNHIWQIGRIVFNFINDIENKDKKTIDDKFIECLNNIKNKFKDIKEEFYKENSIDESDIKETINYDCTLTEFYENLLNIKEKYGKEKLIDKLLEKEIEKYQTYVGYDKISILVKVCMNNTRIKIKKNKYVYTQKDIDEMHQEILECFHMYYSLKQKIDELDTIVANIYDKKIKNEYNTLKINFEKGRAFSDIEKNIKELEEMIDKYNKENKKKIEFKNNEQQINQIYQSLITRYSQETRQYDIIQEQSLINKQLTFLKELLELYCIGCTEFKDIDYFNLFNKITFTDIENDNKIKEIIVKNSKIGQSKIYIRIKYTHILGMDLGREAFYYLDEFKNQIYQACYGMATNICLATKVKEVGDNYISLEEFLDKATFIGENKVDINMNIYAVIYEMDDYLLCIKDDEFCIKYRKPLYKTSEKKYIHLDVYKDKKYLIDLIEKQIEQTIEEQEKKKETQNPQSTEYRKSTAYVKHDKDERKKYKKIIYTSQSDETSHMDDKFYESVFGEEPLNTDDSYGYNNSGKRKR